MRAFRRSAPEDRSTDGDRDELGDTGSQTDAFTECCFEHDPKHDDGDAIIEQTLAFDDRGQPFRGTKFGEDRKD